MKNASSFVTDKPRFEILDGLRGVAALLVLIYHHLEMYSPGNPVNAWINHGYLAVDFFFILSGYVIGYAYDDRWQTMSLGTFFKRRLIRLHPMIIFATIFGAALFYFGSDKLFGIIHTCPVWKLLAISLLGMLMFPIPVSWDIRGWQEFCPINGNAWTLYYEYFANILYALVIRHFKLWMLILITLASAFLTLNLSLNWDVFGTLANRTAQQYTMIGGWTLEPKHVTIGFSRLLFPFFAGLVLARLGSKISIKGGFWWSIGFLTLLLVLPRVGGATHPLWNGLYEAITILILFPILVTLGAGSTVQGRSEKICKWLGEISYPLYIIHYPIAFGLVSSWKMENPNAPLMTELGVHITGFAASILVAQCALTFYDKPVRKWLSKRGHANQG